MVEEEEDGKGAGTMVEEEDRRGRRCKRGKKMAEEEVNE